MNPVIVDYGVGNLFSLSNSLSFLGYQPVVTRNPEVLSQADHILLPGVGAFGDAMDKLEDTGLMEVLLRQVEKGSYLLGICLGMQLLFTESEEFGLHRGLDLLSGRVVDIRSRVPDTLKVPHMGWNSLHFVREDPLFQGIPEGSYVYFVHSFFADDCQDCVTATTDYGIALTAACRKGRVMGCQFHPEKSGKTGLAVLKNFCQLPV